MLNFVPHFNRKMNKLFESIMKQTTVLSRQEQRLNGEAREEKAPNRQLSLLQQSQAAKPVIDVERGLYFTQSFRLTEGQPLIVRWAKALMHYAQNATVYIDDNQLIAGRAGKQGRYGILYPELDGNVLGEAVGRLPERAYSPFDISPGDAEIIQKQIAP
jgi:formate C-acetyltransferase